VHTAVLATLALLVAACGPKLDSDGVGLDVPPADTTASGVVAVSGSSTVEPISALVAEEFMAQNRNVRVTVDGPGTGDGFELFCAGDIDVADASRPIKDEEVAACEEAGVEFIELAVGIDGLSVIAPESNELECLSFQDLYALVGPESEGFSNWTDAQDLAAELGSDTEFPDQNLVVTAPGAESGTFDSFVELVIEPAGEPRVAAGLLTEDEVATARDDYSAQPDDNAIIEGVTSDDGGLGWAGFAYADQAEGIHLVPIAAEPGDPCIAPTTESIQDGSYPISRTLYVYVNAGHAEENPGLAAYIDFYLGGLQVFVEYSDYIALADDAETLARWADRTTGRQVDV
jgi:phosphate transport system substrate-binding protein